MTRATSKSASVKVCGNKEHPTVEEAGGSSVLHAAALSTHMPEEPSRSPPAPTSSPGSFQAGAPLSVGAEGTRGSVRLRPLLSTRNSHSIVNQPHSSTK